MQTLVKGWDVRLEAESAGELVGVGRSSKGQGSIVIFPKKVERTDRLPLSAQGPQMPSSAQGRLLIAFPSGAEEGRLDVLQL